jgi:hypothetical protein
MVAIARICGRIVGKSTMKLSMWASLARHVRSCADRVFRSQGYSRNESLAKIIEVYMPYPKVLPMDLRQLRYFKMVADERNFTRARSACTSPSPPQSPDSATGGGTRDQPVRPRATPLGLPSQAACSTIRPTNSLPEWRTWTMMASAIATPKTIAIGFVASTMYARLPGLIRAFRKAAPDVELSLVEMGSIDQIAALKEGLIDVGFGRIRFDDPAVRQPSCEKSNWS